MTSEPQTIMAKEEDGLIKSRDENIILEIRYTKNTVHSSIEVYYE
jgi:hypothetical protein